MGKANISRVGKGTDELEGIEIITLAVNVSGLTFTDERSGDDGYRASKIVTLTKAQAGVPNDYQMLGLEPILAQVTAATRLRSTDSPSKLSTAYIDISNQSLGIVVYFGQSSTNNNTARIIVKVLCRRGNYLNMGSRDVGRLGGYIEEALMEVTGVQY